MLAIKPLLTEQEQIYSLLSHQAGVTITAADVIVKSKTATTNTDADGNYVDQIKLEFVPGSKVLQANDGITIADTTYTCLKLSNLYAAMNLDATPVLYVKTAEELKLFDSSTPPAAGFDLFEQAFGIKIAAANVTRWAIDGFNSGNRDKYIVAYLDLTHFGFRGTGMLRVEIDQRVDFSSVFNATPLDGFGNPVTATTLEGTEDMIIPDAPDGETVSE